MQAWDRRQGAGGFRHGVAHTGFQAEFTCQQGAAGRVHRHGAEGRVEQALGMGIQAEDCKWGL